jgi:hypothetical protein
MTRKSSSTLNSSSSIRIRLATDDDRPRLIPLINAAFAIETFLEGTRTDEERLATMMRKSQPVGHTAFRSAHT